MAKAIRFWFQARRSSLLEERCMSQKRAKRAGCLLGAPVDLAEEPRDAGEILYHTNQYNILGESHPFLVSGEAIELARGALHEPKKSEASGLLVGSPR
jgi:hypothetical protein